MKISREEDAHRVDKLLFLSTLILLIMCMCMYIYVYLSADDYNTNIDMLNLGTDGCMLKIFIYTYIIIIA